MLTFNFCPTNIEKDESRHASLEEVYNKDHSIHANLEKMKYDPKLGQLS